MPELSGPAWVPRFPTSTSTSDLIASFRPGVDAFLNALRNAGATVSISATLRPRERAHLMHYSWRIAREGFDPGAVPAMSGVDIDWVHRQGGAPDLNASRNAAEQMVQGYNIVERPALNSRHTEGRAVDMNVSWVGNDDSKSRRNKCHDLYNATYRHEYWPSCRWRDVRRPKVGQRSAPLVRRWALI